MSRLTPSDSKENIKSSSSSSVSTSISSGSTAASDLPSSSSGASTRSKQIMNIPLSNVASPSNAANPISMAPSPLALAQATATTTASPQLEGLLGNDLQMQAVQLQLLQQALAGGSIGWNAPQQTNFLAANPLLAASLLQLAIATPQSSSTFLSSLSSLSSLLGNIGTAPVPAAAAAASSAPPPPSTQSMERTSAELSNPTYQEFKTSNAVQTDATESNFDPPAEPIRTPCKARGMPDDHNCETAYFIIPTDIKHGEGLQCSHPGCRKNGIRFRFCSVCSLPVAKRNFTTRHQHRDVIERSIMRERLASLKTSESSREVAVKASNYEQFKLQDKSVISTHPENHHHPGTTTTTATTSIASNNNHHNHYIGKEPKSNDIFAHSAAAIVALSSTKSSSSSGTLIENGPVLDKNESRSSFPDSKAAQPHNKNSNASLSSFSYSLQNPSSGDPTMLKDNREGLDRNNKASKVAKVHNTFPTSNGRVNSDNKSNVTCGQVHSELNGKGYRESKKRHYKDVKNSKTDRKKYKVDSNAAMNERVFKTSSRHERGRNSYRGDAATNERKAKEKSNRFRQSMGC